MASPVQEDVDQAGTDQMLGLRFSLIIPVYNVQDYLDECLGSVFAQDFSDFEILCINDGSTDASAEILAKAATKDNRLRVINQENKGVSAARNEGLNAARGEFIIFLDSDDRLKSSACSQVLTRFEQTQADIVTFGAQCFPPEAASDHLQECLSPRDVVYTSFSEELLFQEKSRPYVWRSAFRRSFLEEKQLRFCEDMLFGEDQIFHFCAYPQAHTVALMSAKLYEYRLSRAGSLMSQAIGDDAQRVRDHLETIRHIAQVWCAAAWFERFGWRTLAWFVEFVAFDLYGLDVQHQIELKPQLAQILREALGVGSDQKAVQKKIEALSFGGATKALLRDILSSSDTLRVGRLGLLRFYLERRGLKASLKRALETLGQAAKK